MTVLRFRLIPLALVTAAWYLLTIASCDERGASSPLARDTTGPQTIAPIEYSPALSHNYTTIYYVHRDTTYPVNNGIYRANVAQPDREPVVLGNFTQPTVDPGRDRVGFLDGSTIKYYDEDDDSVVTPPYPSGVVSVVFVNDSLVAAQVAGNKITTINADFPDTVDGYDVVLHDTDTILFVRNVSPTQYEIIKRAVTDGSEIVFHTISSNLPIRWPSIYRTTGRLAYAAQSGNRYAITTTDISGPSSHVIDTTTYPKSCLIGYDALLYTKESGRFYNSRFDGSFEFMFLPSVSP
jgi:hypothetical protein